jgi:hypothetical protein
LEDHYLQGLQDSSIQEAREQAKEGNTSSVGDSISRAGYASQELGKVKGRPRSLAGIVEEVEGEFERSAPRVYLSEFFQRHPGEVMVHALPYLSKSEGKSQGLPSLENNPVVGGTTIHYKVKSGELDGREVWKNFLEKIIKDKPTISASSIGGESKASTSGQWSNSSGGIFGSKIGVIIGDGEIYAAFPSDGLTYAVTPKIRSYRPSKTPGRESILTAIDSAVKDKGSYNEFVVGKPTVTGLFANPREVSKNTLADMRTKARELGVPFYTYSNHSGLRLDDSSKEKNRAA